MSSNRSIVVFGLSILVAAFLLGSVSTGKVVHAAKSGKALAITLEEARKIALKRVPGTVEDEYSIEDDEGKVTDYIFYIKDKKGKTWEVQIEAEKGTVVSAEEQSDDDEDDPPADEDPPFGTIGS